MELKIELSAFIEMITDAHMAGQHDAGCPHASYGNARAYYTHDVENKIKNLGESSSRLSAVSGCKCLVEFAVSSTLIKDKNHGTLNIINDLRKIKAVSKEEAVGKYMIVISEEFPDHYVHVRPCAMEI